MVSEPDVWHSDGNTSTWAAWGLKDRPLALRYCGEPAQAPHSNKFKPDPKAGDRPAVEDVWPTKTIFGMLRNHGMVNSIRIWFGNLWKCRRGISTPWPDAETRRGLCSWVKWASVMTQTKSSVCSRSSKQMSLPMESRVKSVVLPCDLLKSCDFLFVLWPMEFMIAHEIIWYLHEVYDFSCCCLLFPGRQGAGQRLQEEGAFASLDLWWIESFFEKLDDLPKDLSLTLDISRPIWLEFLGDLSFGFPRLMFI